MYAVVQVCKPQLWCSTLGSDSVRVPVISIVVWLQLAQTTMRSELGKITLDKTFEERAALNENIVKSIQ